MGIEIERKFLVLGDAWRATATQRLRMRQGYLTTDGPSSVRIRISGEEARFNLKSAEVGTTRLEFDWAVPLAEAEQILDRLCHRPLIEKVRHLVPHGGHVWEIDEFEGENAGLVVAELELGAADERFDRPAWLGREVTTERRYYNQALVEHPFGAWSAEEKAG